MGSIPRPCRFLGLSGDAEQAFVNDSAERFQPRQRDHRHSGENFTCRKIKLGNAHARGPSFDDIVYHLGHKRRKKLPFGKRKIVSLNTLAFSADFSSGEPLLACVLRFRSGIEAGANRPPAGELAIGSRAGELDRAQNSLEAIPF
jgi:hypothetical protein